MRQQAEGIETDGSTSEKLGHSENEFMVALTKSEAMIPASEIAKMFGLNPENLRKRLDRWRDKHADGYECVPESARRPRHAHYIYQIAAIRPVIDDMLKKK